MYWEDTRPTTAVSELRERVVAFFHKGNLYAPHFQVLERGGRLFAENEEEGIMELAYEEREWRSVTEEIYQSWFLDC